MSETGLESGHQNSFYERYSEYSDRQIKDILKNHRNYQEAAVLAAVKVAIDRGLIHSEQDLMAPEYQTKPSAGLSIFPEITSYYQYKNVTKSIYRILFLIALVPVVFGVFKYSEGQSELSIAGFAVGFAWALLTYLLLKTKKGATVWMMTLLVALVSVVAGGWIFSKEKIVLLDLFMLAIGALLPVYFIFYLKKLHQTKPDQI